MSIKLPAYFQGFNSKADGSAGIRFSTQELKAEEFAELQRNLNGFGWLVFEQGENAQVDIPEELPVEDGKTPSQRLRGVMFLVWKEKNIGGDFEVWRRNQMEKLIEGYKNKLEQ